MLINVRQLFTITKKTVENLKNDYLNVPTRTHFLSYIFYLMLIGALFLVEIV
jgi:hypothetical protein